MRYEDTRNALVQKLVDSGIVPASDISVENQDFNPQGKSLYLAAFFIPADTEMLGKTFASSDQLTGIFQISVYVQKPSDSYDLIQLQTIDQIISEFSYGSQAVYNGHNVDILESTVNNGIEDDAWFKRDISINYLTFSER